MNFSLRDTPRPLFPPGKAGYAEGADSNKSRAEGSGTAFSDTSSSMIPPFGDKLSNVIESLSYRR